MVAPQCRPSPATLFTVDSFSRAVRPRCHLLTHVYKFKLRWEALLLENVRAHAVYYCLRMPTHRFHLRLCKRPYSRRRLSSEESDRMSSTAKRRAL